MRSRADYRRWFELQLDAVATVILALNPPKVNPKIHPGYKWGHAAKVLSVFVRDVILHSRYFEDAEAKRLAPLLYCPVDRIVLARLRKLGEWHGNESIGGLSEETFTAIQAALREAAATADVPPVWFDDNWGDRQSAKASTGG